MGILDEAIREHLELKRQHGAGEDELEQLEDEAFGATQRPGDGEPDPSTEAPTEFMAQPDLGEEAAERQSPSVADLQEGPESPHEAAPAEDQGTLPAEHEAPFAEQGASEQGESAVGGEQAALEPPLDEDADPDRGEPDDEQAPAMEYEAIPEPPAAPPPEAESEATEPPRGPETEERHVIADQPTELYDVEGEEFASGGSPAPAEETPAEDAPFEDEDEDFFDEKRLSDELDQALEAPPREPEQEGRPETSEAGQAGLAPQEPAPPPSAPDAAEAAPEEPGSPADEPTEPSDSTDEPEGPDSAADGPEEDVLEETPDFLEESEDERLWFEQKPPKDFDFDD